MKKTFCLLFLCLLFAGTFSQRLVLKGIITDVDTVLVVLKGTDQADTVMTTNGRFSFHKNLPTPEIFRIICVKNQQSINALREGNERKMRSRDDGVTRELFLESGDVVIQSQFSEFAKVRPLLDKHEMQDKYEEFRRRIDPITKIARVVIDRSWDSGRTEPEKKLCNELLQKVNNVKAQVAGKYVLENTGNAAGAYVFYHYLPEEKNIGKLDSMYRLFPASLYGSPYLREMNSRISRMKLLQNGLPAPLFSSITQDGKAFDLAKLKGRLVVLDFWGSWCMPCVQGLPRMKQYYEKYKASIEFVGIACNDNETAWRNTIEGYGLTWPQLWNGKDKQDLSRLYHILAYPTKVIIDKNGELVGVFRGETDSFYERVDLLLLSLK